MKKSLLLALAVVSAAMLAVPALASAQTSHIDALTTFTVTGGASELSDTSGLKLTGTSITGSGEFTTTTTGTMKLTFHGVTEHPFGTKCGSTLDGHLQSSGTVTTKALTFHTIMLATGKPGVLITPGEGGVFAKFSCLGIEKTVTGNGILGTITAPECGVASTTATLKFRKSAAGHQEDKVYTGVTYDLHDGPNANNTAAMDIPLDSKIHFPAARKIECTHTA